MRQLLLLRHAKSDWGESGQSDHARALSASGRRGAIIIREAMRGLGLVPDIVLVSAARRTRETLELLEPWDETPIIEEMEDLYLAPRPRLLRVLNGLPETARSVLLIGHNPGLHELALALAGPHALAAGGPYLERLAAAYPTAALAEFAIAGPWWTLADGGGRLLRFLTPGDLPEHVA